MKRFLAYVNGAFVEASDGAWSVVQNPATGADVFEVPRCTKDDVDRAVDAAFEAQKSWRKTNAILRGDALRKIASALAENAQEVAAVLSTEQGKTPPQALGEVMGAVKLLNYHAGWDRRISGEILPGDGNSRENIFLFREPVGVVACVLPWNFPIYVLMRKVAPALITGCTVVVKPSGDTPASALALAKIFEAAGLPQGVFNVVTGSGAVIGEALSSHPKVAMVTLTGSEKTGKQIMRTAASHVAKVSLELGGKAPAVVMTDADLDLAADCIVGSRLSNAGQVCSCTERVYVQRPVFDAFVEKIKQRFEAATFGDGAVDPGFTMGAMVNRAAVERVHGMVERAVAAGAAIVTGGQMPEGPGAFYPPTLLTGATQDSEIVQEEVFGPVLPLLPFDTPQEALALACDCRYGLTSTLYTTSYHTAMLFANHIEAGELYINRKQGEAVHGYHAGWKMSGLGGDDGKHGLEEFLKTRIVYMDFVE